MKQFDIVQFDKLKAEGQNTFQTEDNTLNVMYEHLNSYQHDIIQESSPIKHSFSYHKSTLNLKGEEKYFYGFAIGIHKLYNREGYLINEINHDLPFKFSLERIRQLILSEFNKDIMDIGEQIRVSRSINPSPHYIITIPTNNLLIQDLRALKVDGLTGKILVDSLNKL